MPSCLGIYIEENIIKYAKVQKEKESIKVESFNVEFYDNLSEALDKIVRETYSYNIPISVNVSNELYNYFEVFYMLNKQDINKSLNIEFEMLCNEKGYNLNMLESRYILMKSKENQDKYRALHISVNKADIEKKKQQLSKYKITAMAPISTSITNLINFGKNDNTVIINIEDETKITKVIDGQIYSINILQDGMGKILNNINKTENSIKKSYEVCKNITIYNQDTQNLMAEETEYLDVVMPTLYKIVTEAKKIIDNSPETIDKVYITGLGTSINNIDLYFQEYLVNTKCEILRPFFIETSSIKVPIKDYIEVNSAMAIALNGLGYLNKELNFINTKSSGKDLKTILTGDVKISFDFKEKFDVFEKLIARGIAATLITTIGFTCFSSIVTAQITNKKNEIAGEMSKVDKELSSMQNDLTTINTETQVYTEKINSYNSLSEVSDESMNKRIIRKDAIPNMLNRIMFVIPQKVKITSIKNTESDHIVIEAEAEQYEQLGYFTAVLKTESILNNIKSTSGLRTGSVVKVTIEGDLP